MNSRWTRPALWLSATLACSAIAFSTGQEGFIPPVDPGEMLVSKACLTCHELRPIETTAMDSAGWTSTVNSMIDKGAELKKEDVPVVVKYLVRSYGPLPDGAGKPIFLEVCTRCHTLDRVKEKGASREGWDEILMHMLNEGAPLSDSEYPVLLNYLARNFRP